MNIYQKNKLEFDKFGVTVVKNLFNNKEINNLELRLKNILKKTKIILKARILILLKKKLILFINLKINFLTNFLNKKKLCL